MEKPKKVKLIPKKSPEQVLDVQAPSKQTVSPDEADDTLITDIYSSNRLDRLLELNQDNLLQGIILAEVLGKPKARRRGLR